MASQFDDDKEQVEEIKEIPGLQQQTEPSLDATEQLCKEKKLTRRIDKRMMPCLWIMYIMNYIDRGNIAAARLKGLEADLNLTSEQYSTVISILFVTYVSIQVPSNLLMNKLSRPGTYICVAMMSWGLVSGLTALTQSYQGLLAVRLVLGLTEAAFFPGAMFLMSAWYTKKELSLRMAGLYSAALLSNAFGSLFAAGILAGLEGARGIRGWRWLFIVEGCATVTIAFVCIFFLPDFPRSAHFLNEEERALAVSRLSVDGGGSDQDTDGSFLYGFVLAVKDIKVWMLSLSLWFITAGDSYSAYFPTLTKTLGFNSTDSLLLSAPPFIFATIFAILNARHADKTGERFWHIVGPVLLACVGCIIPLATTNVAARFVALFLLAGSFAGYVVHLAWLSNTISRPPAKRAAALAFCNAFANTANIAGGYFFVSDIFGPTYKLSFVIVIVMFSCLIANAFVTRTYLKRLNSRAELAERGGDDLELAPSALCATRTPAGKPLRYLY